MIRALLFVGIACVSTCGAAQTVDATALLSAEVLDERGRMLGEIRDLAVDLEAGVISYAVFADRPRVSGRQRLQVIAMDSLRPALKRGALVFSGPPAIHRPDLEARLMRMRNLLGMPVENRDGQALGVIADIAVELATGRLGEVALERHPDEEDMTNRVAFAALSFPRGAGRAVVVFPQTIGRSPWPSP